MIHYHQEFTQRVSHIPFHGIGLSVDVYSPDLVELTNQLQQNDLLFRYLEIFKASESSLAEVRSRLPAIFLEYHADGLWVTQPDWMTSYPYQHEFRVAEAHVRELGCSWLNQECATKQMAGHSFGTYLPPLFTEDSAYMTASNVLRAQGWLDEQWRRDGRFPPLFLLETPPLTYFCCGDLSYPEFFRVLAEQCSCGFVLDIGHIWTVYRYACEWQGQSVGRFVEEFLSTFPLDRVVQIHIAGLDFHPVVPREKKGCVPWPNWVDAHYAPIPPILFDMLDQVLSHPGLINVKGLAVEVDTKPVELIIEEFARFRERYSEWEKCCDLVKPPEADQEISSTLSPNFFSSSVSEKKVKLENDYNLYSKVVTAQGVDASPWNNAAVSSMSGVKSYVEWYLPYEILVWGGCLEGMFPNTIKALNVAGAGIDSFVEYWVGSSHSYDESYDYFLIKIHYFLEFIQARFPHLESLASQEADILRQGYAVACHVKENHDVKDSGHSCVSDQ